VCVRNSTWPVHVERAESMVRVFVEAKAKATSGQGKDVAIPKDETAPTRWADYGEINFEQFMSLEPWSSSTGEHLNRVLVTRLVWELVYGPNKMAGLGGVCPQQTCSRMYAREHCS
jgi:hypothetical protein